MCVVREDVVPQDLHVHTHTHTHTVDRVVDWPVVRGSHMRHWGIMIATVMWSCPNWWVGEEMLRISGSETGPWSKSQEQQVPPAKHAGAAPLAPPFAPPPHLPATSPTCAVRQQLAAKPCRQMRSTRESRNSSKSTLRPPRRGAHTTCEGPFVVIRAKVRV